MFKDNLFKNNEHAIETATKLTGIDGMLLYIEKTEKLINILKSNTENIKHNIELYQAFINSYAYNDDN
jgi:hypothetical protein